MEEKMICNCDKAELPILLIGERKRIKWLKYFIYIRYFKQYWQLQWIVTLPMLSKALQTFKTYDHKSYQIDDLLKDKAPFK